jgi:hypothetical protein
MITAIFSVRNRVLIKGVTYFPGNHVRARFRGWSSRARCQSSKGRLRALVQTSGRPRSRPRSGSSSGLETHGSRIGQDQLVPTLVHRSPHRGLRTGGRWVALPRTCLLSICQVGGRCGDRGVACFVGEFLVYHIPLDIRDHRLALEGDFRFLNESVLVAGQRDPCHAVHCHCPCSSRITDISVTITATMHSPVSPRI